MNSLKTVLGKFADVEIFLGEREVHLPDVSQFERELRTLRQFSRSMLVVYVALLVVLFVVQIALVVVFAKSPGFVVGSFAVSGVTATGVLYRMERTWRDGMRAGMFLALVNRLPEERLREIAWTLFHDWFVERSPSSTPSDLRKSTDFQANDVEPKKGDESLK